MSNLVDYFVFHLQHLSFLSTHTSFSQVSLRSFCFFLPQSPNKPLFHGLIFRLPSLLERCLQPSEGETSSVCCLLRGESNVLLDFAAGTGVVVHGVGPPLLPTSLCSRPRPRSFTQIWERMASSRNIRKQRGHRPLGNALCSVGVSSEGRWKIRAVAWILFV